MSIIITFVLLYFAAWASFFTGLCRQWGLFLAKDAVAGCGWFALSNVLFVGAAWASNNLSPWLSLNVLAFLINFYRWWKGRKDRRDKVRKLIGAKAKALRDKLVQNMPRPSLPPIRIPVPAGA